MKLDQEQEPVSRGRIWRDVIIAFLGVVLLVTSYFLLKDLNGLYLRGLLVPPRHLRQFSSSVPLAAPTVDTIESWMTFDYLNRVFHLPPTYLAGRLSIQDPRYPRMSINRFARDTNAAVLTAVKEVQQAIREYQPTQP